MKKLKVCHINAYYHSIGGIENYLRNLFKGLGSHDVEIHIVCSGSEKESYPMDNVHFHYLNTSGRHLVSKVTFKLRKELEAVVEDNGINLIHTHNLFYLAGISSEIKIKVPVIVTLHSGKINLKNINFTNFASETKEQLMRQIGRYFSRDCVLTSVSESAAQPFRDAQVTNIGSMVDTSFFNPALGDGDSLRKELGLEGTITAIYPARIIPGKNQFGAIRIAENVYKENKDFRMLIVGPALNKNYYNAITRYVQENKIKFVRIVERVDKNEMRTLYNLSDLVLFPSRLEEGLGLVLLEGFAMTKPAVAANVGGVPEVVQDGFTGYLFNPGNEQEGAEKVLALISDSANLKQMGLNGRNLVEQKYSINVHAAKVYELYKRTIEQWGRK